MVGHLPTGTDPMSVTYTATDSTGTVHTRTSARHTAPIYTHAVVLKPGDTKKSLVRFSSRRDLALKNLQDALSHSYLGVRSYPHAEIVDLVAIVKQKRGQS